MALGVQRKERAEFLNTVLLFRAVKCLATFMAAIQQILRVCCNSLLHTLWTEKKLSLEIAKCPPMAGNGMAPG